MVIPQKKPSKNQAGLPPIIRQNPPNQLENLLANGEFSRAQHSMVILQHMHMMYIEL